MTAPLLSVEKLTVALPQGGERAFAVQDVNLTLERGEVLCIVGESGSGKSITASAMMNLLPSDLLTIRSGRIDFQGTDLLSLSERRMRDIRGNRISMIFQEPMTSLNPVARIGDQLAQVLEAHGVAARDRPTRVMELVRAVGLPDPEGIVKRYPFRLSGGQRQRVMIAMALAMEPDILIADEPTTALDVTTQAQILRLIRALQRDRGMGVLFITHDFGVVADIADRVAVMQNGEVVEQGPIDRVLNAPAHPYTRKLIAAVPRFRETAAAARGETPLLSVRDLTKIYRSGGPIRGVKEVRAVDGVSFDIRRGETLGLVGESGSGKSTIGQCLMRIASVEGGEIRFDGRDISHVRGADLLAYRARAQMVFQDPFASLNPRHRIGRSILSGPLAHGVPHCKAQARMARLLERVGLNAAAAERYPHEFSGGQRQRIGIARALAVEPDLLIADEAVSALDVSVQAQVLDLLREIRDEFDLAMLFITHDLRVASNICDRVVVLHRGRIVEQGPVTQVFSSPGDDYTKELLGAVPGRSWHGDPQQGAAEIGPTHTSKE
ncbi:Glutathione import ATP-binding protein GsiA (plasmid) [Sulfitobacter indolifex]|uniref:ABC transporter-related protein n=1 Tax=Sulfitobacter indolifex HEL-45 TaxID=391624 RepID=A0ABM9X1Z2_9RHOB|nr:ABC transporter ATP-binding protein [Sulfitobacter indolifex]EDQ03481.1 ABC transporter-related protein [Sulfitobacter indolifex HEL-45]UOA20612.1 Glutathione import ATP-binding protein GsiA [Sulfitobacter indolifex]UOA20819.1 Glutathione import ATP-binding protein GsiA [Sulfitobacter indolifex]